LGYQEIIIYTGLPLQSTWAKRWGLDTIENSGIKLIHWDASNIYYDKANINKFFSGSKSYSYQISNYEQVNDYNSLELLVKKLNSDSIVWILNRGPIDHTIKNKDLNILNKYSIKYILSHLIPWQKPKYYRSDFLKYSTSLLKYNFRLKAIRLVNNNKLPRLIIGSGALGYQQVKSVFPHINKYVSIPSYKILWNKTKSIIKNKYIVYVDESPAFAPDAALLGGRMPIHNIEHFYKNMNIIFNKIENWSGFPIVIAASGKYDYKQNPFKNRKIIYLKTLALIQHAEIVIGHGSLALDQVIIERKPVLLLTNDEFPIFKNQRILESAQMYHNKQAINTDNIKKEDYINCYNINHDYYNKIELDYFRDTGVTGTFAENMISAFESIN
jgi:hypothetical protein